MNTTNDDGTSAMMIACRMGYMDITMLLLSYDASIHHRNHDGHDALLETVCGSNSSYNCSGGDGSGSSNGDSSDYNKNVYDHADSNSDNIIKRIELIRLLVTSGIYIYNNN